MPGKATLFATLLACAALAGCADHKLSEQSLAKAQSEFDQVKEDSDVLRAAPKDVIRAGESLARAERLSSYWGSSSDVIQYAYLSQRYSEIARQHALLNLNQERLTRLQLERERLQLALREAKLLSVQEQGQRLSEEIASLSTEETERGLVLTLGDVLFDFNRAELKPAANRTALKLVQFLQLNPRRVIRIEGYTDSVGDRQANLDLSRERAQAVADVLADLGVDPARMQVVGYGEAFPVTDNASNRDGRRTAGWRSSSPTTRASSARRAENRAAAGSPATPKGPGLFSSGEPGGAGFLCQNLRKSGLSSGSN